MKVLNLYNFVSDDEYGIIIEDNNICFYKYIKIVFASDKKIILKFSKFLLIVEGNGIVLSKMLEKELIFKYTEILKVEFNYE